MKKVYVSEAVNNKVIAFNKAKARGFHQPYVTTKFMSIGTRSTFWCPVQERDIDVLSQGEKRVYFSEIFDHDVVDIKEQYPLDYVLTQRIAKMHRVIHPRDHVTGELKVMTTDFVITRKDQQGKHYRIACSVKDKVDSRRASRTKEKLELEKAYWQRFGVSHSFLLEKDIDRIKAMNIICLSAHFEKRYTSESLSQFTFAFIDTLVSYPADCLKKTISRVAHASHISTQQAYRFYATSVLRHKLCIDLSTPQNFGEPVALAA